MPTKAPHTNKPTKPHDQLEKSYRQRTPDMDHKANQTSAEIAAQLREKQLIRNKGADFAEQMAIRQARVTEMVSSQLAMLRAAHDAGKVDLYNAEEVWDNAMHYMEACVMRGSIPSMMELAVCLGYTWRGVQNWTQKHPQTRTAELWGILRDATASWRNGLALEKVTDNLMTIYMSNNSGTGLSNNPTAEPEKEDPLEEYKTPDEVRKKYQNLDE